MENKDIIEFFDRCAPSRDTEMVKDDEIIDTILKDGENSKMQMDVTMFEFFHH